MAYLGPSEIVGEMKRRARVIDEQKLATANQGLHSVNGYEPSAGGAAQP